MDADGKIDTIIGGLVIGGVGVVLLTAFVIPTSLSAIADMIRLDADTAQYEILLKAVILVLIVGLIGGALKLFLGSGGNK